MSNSNQSLISNFFYKRIESGEFAKVDDNVYLLEKEDSVGNSSICMIVLGYIPEAVISLFQNKIDCLISLPPKTLMDNSLIKPPTQSTHINAENTLYTQASGEAKSILLKPGHFLVEFLPEENGDNYEYLYRVKDLARKAGFEYYAKVPWKIISTDSGK